MLCENMAVHPFVLKIIQQYVFLLQKMLVCARICVTQKGEENV